MSAFFTASSGFLSDALFRLVCGGVENPQVPVTIPTTPGRRVCLMPATNCISMAEPLAYLLPFDGVFGIDNSQALYRAGDSRFITDTSHSCFKAFFPLTSDKTLLRMMPDSSNYDHLTGDEVASTSYEPMKEPVEVRTRTPQASFACGADPSASRSPLAPPQKAKSPR